jgi:hypothetical protein
MEIKIRFKNSSETLALQVDSEGVPRSRIMENLFDAMRPGSNIVLDFNINTGGQLLVQGSEIAAVWVQ